MHISNVSLEINGISVNLEGMDFTSPSEAAEFFNNLRDARAVANPSYVELNGVADGRKINVIVVVRR